MGKFLMNKSILLTRPDYDLATKYLFYWTKPIIKLAKQKNFKVVDLDCDKANKIDFTGRIRKINPSFLFFNGHGSSTSIMGQDGEILVSVSGNIKTLRDKIIYSRSCSSAKKLGSKAVSLGAKTFIGYKEPFIFIHDSRKSSRPLVDKDAKLFLDPSNKVASTLLKGHTTLEADKRAKDAFKRNIRKLLTSETKKEDSSALRFLYWDMKHQVCLGGKNACL